VHLYLHSLARFVLFDLDLTTKHLTTMIDTPYTDISSVKAQGKIVVFTAEFAD